MLEVGSGSIAPAVTGDVGKSKASAGDLGSLDVDAGRAPDGLPADVAGADAAADDDAEWFEAEWFELDSDDGAAAVALTPRAAVVALESGKRPSEAVSYPASLSI
jgi:hypothetical protein